MNKFIGKGIIAAMPTPFTMDQKIDKQSVKALVNYLIKNGVDGILVGGGAGECSLLNFEEKKELMQLVVMESKGRVPIYVGAGAITTSESILLAQYAQDIVADALVLLPSCTINPNQDELYIHFREIASNTSLPIFLYNHPKRTGVNLSIDLVAKLSKINNIVGIKDSSGDFSLTVSYLKLKSEKFSIFTGIDTFILAGLVYGAQGSISSAAGAVPGLVVQIYQSFIKGDYEAAIKAQNKLIPYREAFSLGTFPAVLKETLNMIGIAVGKPRLPIQELSRESCIELRGILKNII
jgi:4-hydroxy-tetrahydrodipicolinate synthase